LVSFEDVYKAERSGLVRYLMTMGADQYQADDAVQAAFARDLLPEVPGPLDSGDIAVLNEEEEMVRAAVAALPGRQRQVMALLAAGFTTAEIAEQLACDQGAVRQALARARDGLARQLGIDRRKPR